MPQTPGRILSLILAATRMAISGQLSKWISEPYEKALLPCPHLFICGQTHNKTSHINHFKYINFS